MSGAECAVKKRKRASLFPQQAAEGRKKDAERKKMAVDRSEMQPLRWRRKQCVHSEDCGASGERLTIGNCHAQSGGCNGGRRRGGAAAEAAAAHAPVETYLQRNMAPWTFHPCWLPPWMT